MDHLGTLKIALLSKSEAPTQEEPGCQVKEELQVGSCYCSNVLNRSVMVARTGPMVCIFLKKKDKKIQKEIVNI